MQYGYKHAFYLNFFHICFLLSIPYRYLYNSSPIRVLFGILWVHCYRFFCYCWWRFAKRILRGTSFYSFILILPMTLGCQLVRFILFYYFRFSLLDIRLKNPPLHIHYYLVNIHFVWCLLLGVYVTIVQTFFYYNLCYLAEEFSLSIFLTTYVYAGIVKFYFIFKNNIRSFWWLHYHIVCNCAFIHLRQKFLHIVFFSLVAKYKILYPISYPFCLLVSSIHPWSIHESVSFVG